MAHKSFHTNTHGAMHARYLKSFMLSLVKGRSFLKDKETKKIATSKQKPTRRKEKHANEQQQQHLPQSVF